MKKIAWSSFRRSVLGMNAIFWILAAIVWLAAVGVMNLICSKTAVMTGVWLNSLVTLIGVALTGIIGKWAFIE